MQIYDMKSINREEMIELCYIMHIKKPLNAAGSGIKTIYEKVLEGYACNFIFALPKLIRPVGQGVKTHPFHG